MTQIVYQHWDRAWVMWAGIALAMVLVLIGYRGSPLRGGAKFAAMFCKVAALSLLAFLLLEPQLSREVPRKGANEVVIAADNGAGLGVSEQTGGESRGVAMKKALGVGTSGETWIDKLGEMFRVKTMIFDDRLRSVKDFTELKFDGQSSTVCSVARSLSERGASSTTAAVVVLTDGIATDPEAWQVAKGKHAPVFPVIVGSGAVDRDLAITEVSAAQSAFEESPVTITAKVKAFGFEKQDIAISVLDEAKKVVATEKHHFDVAKGEHVFRIRVPTAKSGLSFFRLVLTKAGLEKKLADDSWKKDSAEATLVNNERLISVDRGAGPYRILYVGGRPNWEYKFLHRALTGDPDVQLPSLIRIAKKEPKFEWRGRAGETSNPLFRGFKADGGDEAQRYDQPVWIRLGMKDKKELSDNFPKSQDELFGEYRAIIIDDLEAAAFTQEQMNLIERFVSQRGGSVVMLGGQECYRAGGYDHTPIGQMLPVYLDRVNEERPVADVRFNLTREGWLEPWLRLRTQQEEDEKRLAQMPAFFSVNQAFSIKPGASILATASDSEQKSHPALVVQRFGEGRVAALLVGDMWRWGMQSAEQHADMDKAWRQFMRWLVVDVPDRVVLDQQHSKNGGQEMVKLQVRVRDQGFRPIDDATMKITVEQPGGKKVDLFAEPSLKDAGVFEAEYYPRDDGAYRVKAEIKDGKGESLGERQSGWVYSPLADEFRSLEPDRALLERMAKDTGGRVLELSEVNTLPKLLENLNVPIKETLTEPLWHSPWVFLLILGLLAAEWILRRKAGWV